MDLTQTPLPSSFLAPQGATTIAARTCLLEGPAFDADDNLFFSDIFGNRIYRLAPDGNLSVFRADSGRTNGNTFDASGRLISCEGAEQGPGGRRRVVRTDMKTGQVEVLTERSRGSGITAPTTSLLMFTVASGSPIPTTRRTGRCWRWTRRRSTGSIPAATSGGC